MQRPQLAAHHQGAPATGGAGGGAAGLGGHSGLVGPHCDHTALSMSTTRARCAYCMHHPCAMRRCGCGEVVALVARALHASPPLLRITSAGSCTRGLSEFGITTGNMGRGGGTSCCCVWRAEFVRVGWVGLGDRVVCVCCLVWHKNVG
jgi:hypothetical protein